MLTKKISHNLEKKIIKISQTRGYIYKNVNNSFFIAMVSCSRFVWITNSKWPHDLVGYVTALCTRDF